MALMTALGCLPPFASLGSNGLVIQKLRVAAHGRKNAGAFVVALIVEVPCSTFDGERHGIEFVVRLEPFGILKHRVTETGYRSNFLPCGHVTEYGGAVAFVTTWLDHEAAQTGWNGAQLSLF